MTWHLQTGQDICTLRGHDVAVTSVSVIPDGRHAVSASDDQTLKVWDLQTGRPIATYNAEQKLSACAVSPDGRTVLAGEVSGRLHFLTLAGLDYNP
jgi:WD40 repeat protein